MTSVKDYPELPDQKTSELADLRLIKLLEKGELNFTKVGTHRRIRFEDLMAYKEKRRQESLSAMDELVQQAQEEGMGYH